jgi:hypothetical protein
MKNIVLVIAMLLCFAASPALADEQRGHEGHGGGNRGGENHGGNRGIQNHGGRGDHGAYGNRGDHGRYGENHHWGHDGRWRDGFGPFGYGIGWLWVFAPPFWFVPGVTNCQEVVTPFGVQVECINEFGVWVVVN